MAKKPTFTRILTYSVLLILTAYTAVSVLLTPTIPDSSPPYPLIETCFTPGSHCTSQIQSQITQAKESILVQAYGFTSEPIAQALVAAHHRGVSVKVLLDKSNRTNKSSLASYLLKHHIKVWVDERPAIAHNKVMILDEHTVITGSFNFTRAAQKSNAENIVIIHDPKTAHDYTQNWQRRQIQSVPLNLSGINPPKIRREISKKNVTSVGFTKF